MAEKDPVALGVNVTLIGQVPFAAIEEQEPPAVAVKLAGFEPAKLIAPMLTEPLNVLLTIIVAAALARFKVWEPKDVLAGERLTPPTPAPDKVNMGLGVLGSLSEIIKLPGTVPAAVGVKLT